MAFDITNIKTQLQARIDALTDTSTVEDVLLVSKTVNELVGDGVDLTNLRAQLQAKIDALTGASDLKDVLLVSKTVEAAISPVAQSTLIATADNQLLAIETEGAAQVGVIEAAGATQVGLVQDEGATQVGLVQDEGATQIGLVDSAGSAQVAVIQAEGASYARTGVANTWTAQQTFKALKETVYELTGTVVDPANGTVQYKTLSGNTTLTEALESGQSVLLRVTGGDTHVVTWPTATWVGGSAPTLTTADLIVLWKDAAGLFGAYVGSVAA